MFKILCSICGVILLAIVVSIIVIGIQDGDPKYTVSSEGIDIPLFSEVEINFNHNYDASLNQPFMAGAIIDVDNDGVEELFLGGGVRQSDGLFSFEKDHFIDVAEQAGLVKQGGDATLGVLVLDFDNNGFRDLLVTRKTGIWLYRNTDGHFNSEKIKTDFNGNTTPLNPTIADLNGDGYFDMFVPAYLDDFHSGYGIKFNTARISSTSRLLINNGDDSFSDITEPAGLHSPENGLQAIFTDIDGDNLDDLVVVYRYGKMRIWQNRGSLLFENKRHLYSDTFTLNMGIGVGDYNGDGRPDFFLSNSGSTISKYLARGDLLQDQRMLSKWVLLKNTGDLIFKDEAEKAKLADYELSRGAMFVDLNSDGLMDLVVSQNHPRWPLHRFAQFRLPGRVFLQNKLGQFAEVATSSHMINKNLSITPLSADFNRDGLPDIVHVNMAGRSKVFLSKGSENYYLKVQLPDRVQSLGAVVSVKTLSGKVLKQPFLVGKELCSDSTHILFFGLGKEKVIEVMVHYKNGEEDQTSGVFFNTTVVFNN